MFKMKKGFTLIELLVVIAIIAILAAILFPVFAQAREKARQSSCLSNMKQIGTAFALYVDDYDETTPGVLNWMADAGYMQSNSTSCPEYCLNPYIKNLSIFCCPSKPGRAMMLAHRDHPVSDANGNYVSNDGSVETCGSSYCFNGLAYNFTSLAQLSSPSNLYFCTEHNTDTNWSGASFYPSTTMIMPTPNTIGAPANSFSNCGILAKWNCQEPHNGGQNVTFCDGHAKFYKTGTLTFRNQGINPPAGYNFDDPMPHDADDMNNYNIMQAGKSFSPRYE